MECYKVWYTSERRAKEVITSMHNWKHSRKSKIPKRVYYCKDCKQRHLTSLSKNYEYSTTSKKSS